MASTSANSPSLSKSKNMDSDATPEKILLGIDIGGTYSRVAVIKFKENTENKKADSFEVTYIKEIPSVVSFLENGKCLVGAEAEKRIFRRPLNTFHATKRLIGRRFDEDEVKNSKKCVGYVISKNADDGRAYLFTDQGNWALTIAQFEALILLKLKEFCEKELKITIRDIALTIPPYFVSSYQTQVVFQAASIAGLHVSRVFYSPKAAIIGFGVDHDTLKGVKNVIIYDFGGTSFNATVVVFEEGDYHEGTIMSTVQNHFLGGQNLDEKLMDHFVTELQHKLGITNCTLSKSAIHQLRMLAKNTKEHLSTCMEVDVIVSGIFIENWVSQDEHVHHPKPKSTSRNATFIESLTIQVTRNKFEELVTDLIESTIILCFEALNKAKIRISKDVKVEFLAVGGTSRIPKVQATIEKYFEKKPFEITSTKYDYSSINVIGAALSASMPRYKSPKQLCTSAIRVPEFVREGEVYRSRIVDDDKARTSDATVTSPSRTPILDISVTEDLTGSIICKTCR
ncbi:heat shock protein hsp-6-like [Planococcus citri]|uniref:heat shock protein hsp-6-like n=1 Tax=Planococcus citri TaxID=170843 RepID=UPI0031F7B601